MGLVVWAHIGLLGGHHCLLPYATVLSPIWNFL